MTDAEGFAAQLNLPLGDFWHASCRAAVGMVDRPHIGAAPRDTPVVPRGFRRRGRRAGQRILVLTSALGSGHLAAARAVECGVLDRIPHAEVQTIDFWSLMDRRVARIARTAYLRLVHGEADLYDRVYRLDQEVWRRTLYEGQPPPAPIIDLAGRLLMFVNDAARDRAKPENGSRRLLDRVLFRQTCSSLAAYARGNSSQALVGLALARWCWARLTRRLEARIVAFQPDAVVTTMMWTAALCSRVKERRATGIPLVGVPTDYGVHDFWVQPGISCYCVAHETITNLHRVGSAAVHVTGIPLMPGFRHPPSAEDARRTLGLTEGRPVLLVNGGGLGIGTEDTAARLLGGVPDAQILVLAGQNGAARAALAPLAARHGERLHLHGWTDRPELFLAAADLVIGKLGGLTVAEALACGRPLLATRSLRGQEGFNQRFVEQHGVGWLVTSDALVPRCRSLLADPAGLAHVQHRARLLGQRDGAARIAALIERLTATRHTVAEPA